MMELAWALIFKDLPTGVIVGSAAIKSVTRGDRVFDWQLRDLARAKTFRKLTGHPQPLWFTPF